MPKRRCSRKMMYHFSNCGNIRLNVVTITGIAIRLRVYFTFTITTKSKRYLILCTECVMCQCLFRSLNVDIRLTFAKVCTVFFIRSTHEIYMIDNSNMKSKHVSVLRSNFGSTMCVNFIEISLIHNYIDLKKHQTRQ